jgi:glycosyltransferase involved in cell wall biosynthesis
VRVLLVTQMWPGPADPDYGVFVAQVVQELERRGHEFARAAVDHRGGSRAKHLRLAGDALRLARSGRFDVVYAHFLAPAGLLAGVAARVARAPLVLTAHGQDVRNLGRVAGLRALTARVVRTASSVVAVSGALRDELVAHVPAAAGKAEVVDCGVDVGRFRGGDRLEARRALGLPTDGPLLLFVGGLTERKNVVRLRDAFLALGRGRLAVVGEGPLRPALEGVPGVHLAGAVPHGAVATWMRACDALCLPSLVEPFGQVLLEAMASERPVVATRVGGPPELVTPEVGALVDPLSAASIRTGLEHALALPVPSPAARAVALEHDLRRQAARIEAVLARASASGASARASSDPTTHSAPTAASDARSDVASASRPTSGGPARKPR